jgi:hypothetical protein
VRMRVEDRRVYLVVRGDDLPASTSAPPDRRPRFRPVTTNAIERGYISGFAEKPSDGWLLVRNAQAGVSTGMMAGGTSCPQGEVGQSDHVAAWSRSGAAQVSM